MEGKLLCPRSEIKLNNKSDLCSVSNYFLNTETNRVLKDSNKQFGDIGDRVSLKRIGL